MPGADPNHEAQVARVQAAAKAFAENPSAETARQLRELMDAIVWDD